MPERFRVQSSGRTATFEAAGGFAPSGEPLVTRSVLADIISWLDDADADNNLSWELHVDSNMVWEFEWDSGGRNLIAEWPHPLNDAGYHPLNLGAVLMTPVKD